MKKEFPMNQMKTKYLLISASIHALFIFLLLFHFNLTQPIETIPENIENATSDLQIIELSQGPGKNNLDSDKFYWGIGIESTESFEHNSIYGLIPVLYITDVKQGYSAENAGLQIKDKIFLLNNQPMFGENNIKGDEPKQLYLTILRNGVIINVSLQRVKVYY